MIHASRNELAEAVKSFESSSRPTRHAVAARLQLSRVLMAQGQLERAVQVSREVGGNNVAAELIGARALLKQGKIAEAEKTSRALERRTRSLAAVRNFAGMVALAKKDTTGARRLFEEALKLDASMLEAFAGLVTVDLVTNQRDQARRYGLEAATAANPSSRDLLLLAGKSYLTMKYHHKAAETVDRLIQLDPSHLAAYELLARIYLDQKKLDEALTHYQEVARRQPSSVPAQTVVAILLHSQNRLDEAVKHYEAVLDLDPTAPVAANNLAWILAERSQDLPRAQRLAEAARQKAPERPPYQRHAWLGKPETPLPHRRRSRTAEER